MANGYFLVHRSIWDSQQFKSEPFSQREAFMWMISEAAWKDTSIRYGDHRYNVLRGQFVSSIRRMADVWQWDKCRVDRFLNNLVNDRCLKIETNGAGKPRHITICNYEEYQETRDNGETTNETNLRQPRDNRETYKKETNQLTSKPVEDRDSKESLVQFFEEEFWPIYPRKVRKEAARKACRSALKRASAGKIISGLQSACRHWESNGTTFEFIPHPATWLNAGGWDDEHPVGGGARASPGNAEGETMFDRLRRKFEDEDDDLRVL